MSLPHLLLVDDSDAILNFEKAVLSGLYRLSTASNGVEAVEKIKSLRPDGVLLDLSMPQMDGDEVLKIIKSDQTLADIPFLVVSSEKDRAEACLKAGAEGFLSKPILAEDLKARAALMLESARERERKKSSAFLFVGVGPYELGLPLKLVDSVQSQPATHEAAAPSPHRSEAVDYHGETFSVLDLAGALGAKYGKPLEDRKLLFLRGEDKVAVCVDSVWDPEELLPEQLHEAEKKGKGGRKAGAQGVLSIAESGRGLVPIVHHDTFFSASLLAGLAEYLLGQWERTPVH